jgi:hypothetical protein
VGCFREILPKKWEVFERFSQKVGGFREILTKIVGCFREILPKKWEVFERFSQRWEVLERFSQKDGRL